MRVLVTGGLGFIGSHTCIDLLERNFDIAIVDDLSNSSKEILRILKNLSKKNIEFYENNITDKESIKKIFSEFRPNSVIHFAGLKSVSESIKKPDEYFEVNVKGTQNILNAMDFCGCKKIIFSSSAVVYGKPKYNPCDESHPTNPTNPYGKTKLIAENIIHEWTKKTKNSKAIIFRYFNPIGAHSSGMIGESPLGEANNIMPALLDVAIGKKEFLTIFGNDYETRDGTGVRDYIHICDLSKAHAEGFNRIDDLEGFIILNLGTGKNCSILELLNTFQEATGLKIKNKIASRRSGDLGEVWASNEKAKKMLGIDFPRSIKAMCEDALRYKLKKSS